VTPAPTVHTIDLMFQGTPGVIAAYVLPSADGPVIVDPGPSSTLGALETGLHDLGLGLDEVRHVLLTHIHLDHAGAAGTIAARSGATVYLHERGAGHLARPERLLASAAQIYGEHMDALWGEMRPVPVGQLRALSGGERLNPGGLDLEAIYTPGHAVHHLAWQGGPELFCGDVAGVRLSLAQSPRAPTPPPDIDLEAWRDSVARLRERDAERLHLTHFGTYANTPDYWDALLANMALDAERVRAELETDPDHLAEHFTAAVERDLAAESPDLVGRFDFACPPWMSAQGLVRYWTRRAARPAEGPV
jgi:glyoxylase-like metal-dependent hydrolase (beta-lactamase superfamily II)